MRRHVRDLAISAVIVAIPCAGTTYLLPPDIRLAEYQIVTTAAIDQSNTTVGISDPYLSYPWDTPTSQDVDRAIAAMAAMGVENVRIQIPWAWVQPDNATSYDWSRVDAIVNTAATRGMGVLAVISHTPGWAAESPINGHPDPATFAAFAAATALRYDGKISAYEVWNEPNAALFYDPTDPTAYTALLRAAYTAIKGVDQSLVVVGGVLTSTVTIPGERVNPVDFVQAMYAAGAKGYFDALSFHPYAYPLGTDFSDGEGYGNSSFEQLAAIRRLMVASGDAKLIWATEFGVPTVPGISGATQASVISDFLATWSSFDYTGPMFIHTLNDLAANSPDGEDNFGIFDAAGNAKPAVQVIKDWISTHLPPTPTLDPFQSLVVAVQAFFQGISNFVQGVVSFFNSVVKVIFGGPAAVATPAAAMATNVSVSQQSVAEPVVATARHAATTPETESNRDADGASASGEGGTTLDATASTVGDASLAAPADETSDTEQAAIAEVDAPSPKASSESAVEASPSTKHDSVTSAGVSPADTGKSPERTDADEPERTVAGDSGPVTSRMDAVEQKTTGDRESVSQQRTDTSATTTTSQTTGGEPAA